MIEKKQVLLTLAKQKLAIEERFEKASAEWQELTALKVDAEVIALVELEAEKAQAEMNAIQEAMHSFGTFNECYEALLEAIEEAKQTA